MSVRILSSVVIVTMLVFMSFYPTDQNVTAASTNYKSEPIVVVDSNNDNHIIWLENMGEGSSDYQVVGDHYFYTKVDENGKILVPRTRISSGIVSAWHAQMIMDSNENIHVVWEEGGDVNIYNLYHLRLDNDGDIRSDEKKIISSEQQIIQWTMVNGYDGHIFITWKTMPDLGSGGHRKVYVSKLSGELNEVFTVLIEKDGIPEGYANYSALAPEVLQKGVFWVAVREGKRDISLSNTVFIDARNHFHQISYNRSDKDHQYHYRYDANGTHFGGDFLQMPREFGDFDAYMDGEDNIHMIRSEISPILQYGKVDREGNSLVNTMDIDTSDLSDGHNEDVNLQCDTDGGASVVWVNTWEIGQDTHFEDSEEAYRIVFMKLDRDGEVTVDPMIIDDPSVLDYLSTEMLIMIIFITASLIALGIVIFYRYRKMDKGPGDNNEVTPPHL